MSKANRQKAGVKSASSHGAAELLSGGGLVTFDAFSGGCASILETEDTISLKKLAKRDSSTREKALRELMERCSEENVDTVVSTFSAFAAQFDKIVFDCSPSVRLLAIKLVSKQVNLLKKKAEKDLFNILPSIIFASCDLFSPCASEATNFLNGMFSKEKLDAIVGKMSERLMVMLQEILVSRDSNLLTPSKLLNNDEEDSAGAREARLSEQSYGVIGKLMKGEKNEEIEKILSYRLKSLKKGEMSRGLLSAVSSCPDAVSLMLSCSLFDALLSVFSSPDHSPLLPLSTDLILLLLTASPSPLNENQRKKVVNSFINFIKKASVSEWDWLGVRLLPLFSSLCSLVDESARASFISNWFHSLQTNGIPTKESLLHTGECVKYVVALLDSPSMEEMEQAQSMLYFLISLCCSSADASSLQSLILWSLSRIAPPTIPLFVQEILTRVSEKLPSSRPLMVSLLSLNSPHLFSAWEFLHKKGVDTLPLQLLEQADDAQLVSLNTSIGLLSLLEKSGERSLAALYSRLTSLLPSSSLQRDTLLPYSPLVCAVLSTGDSEGIKRIVRQLEEGDRLKCVDEWSMEENTQSTISFYRAMSEQDKRSIEKKLFSLNSSIEFLANLTSSSEFSSEFAQEVAERVVKGYVVQSLKDTKAVYLSPSTRSIVHRLEVPLTLRLITDQVAKSTDHLKVSSFHSMATLFYDLMESGMNLLDSSSFFSHLLSILSPLVDELTHYSLLSHYWPCSLDTLPSAPSPSNSSLIEAVARMNKILALFTALYVHRSSESPASLLLLPIIVFSSALNLARSSPLSLLAQSVEEKELLHYSSEMIESGRDGVEMEDVLSLLSLCPAPSRPLLLFCLRPLTHSIRSGVFPAHADTPFSALPTEGSTFHLEMARQLFYRRKVDQVLHSIAVHSQSEEASTQELFTLGCDAAHFSLSMSALTGASEYLREEREKEMREEGEESIHSTLSDSTLDFLRCAILTAINSVDGDAPSTAKWEEGRRRGLSAAAIQLAIIMNETRTEEWLDFFLPSITPIVLKMYGEMDMLGGSALSRVINLFVATHPSLKWNKSWSGKWDKKSLRYDMEMDQAGIPSTIQTLVVRASRVLEEASEERGEAIVAAAAIIAMSVSFTVSFSLPKDDEEKTITVLLPPFMKNLAAKDGWSHCGVLAGCLSLLSSCPSSSSSSSSPSTPAEGGEGTGKGEEEKVARSIMCDALAPLITKSLTTLVSKAEQNEERIPAAFYLEKAVPSREYLVHWVARLLREVFSSFPSIVKLWYTALPRSASTLVNGFISSTLSPILIDHEIGQVMEADLPEKHKNDQATLTLRRHTNEILLDYILEDTRMRMTIQMPIGWPLVAPQVAVEGSIVGEQDGRKWMLQLNSQLHRNSSLVCALSAWLVHAGKKVEGTESCTICMQLVAPQTKQLPKARCRQCHNKFHSSCLYKWFESSNQSSCPLCRTDFTAPS